MTTTENIAIIALEKAAAQVIHWAGEEMGAEINSWYPLDGEDLNWIEESIEERGLEAVVEDILQARLDNISCSQCSRDNVPTHDAEIIDGKIICDKCREENETYAWAEETLEELGKALTERYGEERVDDDCSCSSASKYLTLLVDCVYGEDDDLENYREIKIRISDHELPPTYHRTMGSADIEIGPHQDANFRDAKTAIEHIMKKYN